MAFFGITHLGYQNPLGDKMIVKPTRPQERLFLGDAGISIRAGLPQCLQEPKGSLRCTDTCNVSHQPLPYSSDIHNGSHEQYKEMVRRVQIPRSPNQLYVMPVTDSQQYGWMTSSTPEPWTQVKRFPRKNSEMTKFVKDMSATDREFSLF